MKGQCKITLVRALGFYSFFLIFALVYLVKGIFQYEWICPDMAYYAVCVIFLGLELADGFILYRKGYLCCAFAPILFLEILFGQQIHHLTLIYIFAVLLFVIKGVELCLAVVKRRRNELRSEPFYDGADGVVLLSILVDVIILIQIM